MKTLASSLLLVTAALALTACPASKADKKDKVPSEKSLIKEDVRNLPAMAEIPMLDGAPKVAQLATGQGVTSFKVGDLTVIHKVTPANQIVSVQLYFAGGIQRMNSKTQGVESLALSVSTTGGTASMPKDAFNAKLSSLGASVFAFNDRDYSGVAMKTVTTYFDEVWPLFVGAVMEPAIPEGEVALAKKRQLANVQSIMESPDNLVSHLTTQAFFKGHPYQNLQRGTEETIPTFTRDEIAAYQRSMVDPSKMLLVVVGNITAADLQAKLSVSLGKVKGSGEAFAKLPEFTPNAEKMVFAQKKLPTNYIFGLFNAPSPGSADYPAMVVAMDYLSGRLFEEVRTKRNLTYAVSAGVSSRRSNYGYLYVTAADPQATLPVMYAEIDKLISTPLTEQKIRETLNVFLTEYYMDMETNSSQGASLASAYMHTGDFSMAFSFLDQVQKVTPADIQRVIKTYAKDMTFGVVGPDRAKLPKTLFER